MATVQFHKADVSFKLPVAQQKLKTWVNALFEAEKKQLQRIDYIFCSDAYLHQMNQQFLKHDTLTDIITFDLSANDKAGTIGEIYISQPRVLENASLHGDGFRNELLRVIFHGALHLCGYKDKLKTDQAIMRSKEDFYINHFVSQETVSK